MDEKWIDEKNSWNPAKILINQIRFKAHFLETLQDPFFLYGISKFRKFS